MSAPAVLEGFRLSPRQRRLWTLPRPEGAWPFRVQAVAVYEGPASLESLRGAVDAAAARHEALATTFGRLAGMELPLQVIGGAAVAWDGAEELSALDPAAAEAALEEMAARARLAAMDPEAGPHLRVSPARLAPGRHALVLTLSALAGDAGSLEVLAGEAAALHEGMAIDPPAMQHVDVSEWVHELLEADDSAEGRAFWADRAAALAPARLAGERAAEAAEFVPASLEAEVPAGVVDAAARLGEEECAAVADVVLAAWCASLARRSGEAAPAVALEHAGRGFDELRGVVGPLSRHLPLAVDTAEAATFRALARAAAVRAAEAAGWHECHAGDAPAGAPSFAFAWSDDPADVSFGALRVSVSHRAGFGDRFTASLAASRAPGGALTLRLGYDAARLGAREAGRLLEGTLALLADGVARPDAPAASLEALGAAERRRLLVELNDTARPFSPATVGEIVAERARTSPDAPALFFEGRRTTYAELDGEARRLAARLRAAGAVPGSLVALHLARSERVVVAMLAAWKAGAAFVPMDPSLPAERRAALARRASPAVVLADGEAGAEEVASACGAALVRVGGNGSIGIGGDGSVGIDGDGSIWIDGDGSIGIGGVGSIGVDGDGSTGIDGNGSVGIDGHRSIGINGDGSIGIDRSGSAGVDGFVESPAVPEALAYVLFTSGSTGEPKGVAVEHRQLAAYVHGVTEALELDGLASFATVSTFLADLGHTAVFPALCTGAALHVVAQERAADPALLAAYLAE
ncbi:MAG TPA: AMP-binding protein, partial [Longimicrobium sp.]|nr:AMP-binding protein [Longimicrobium sp.]